MEPSKEKTKEKMEGDEAGGLASSSSLLSPHARPYIPQAFFHRQLAPIQPQPAPLQPSLALLQPLLAPLQPQPQLAPPYSYPAHSPPSMLAPVALPQAPIVVEGVMIPDHVTPGTYILTQTLLKTFHGKYGVKGACRQLIGNDLNRYTIHWFGPETHGPSENVPYDPEICMPGTYLDLLLNECWPSCTQPNREVWRRNKWSQHGDKEPNFNQYEYFINSCIIARQLDLTQKMIEVSGACSYKPMWWRNQFWHVGDAGNILATLTKELGGHTPKLVCENLEGRQCIMEIWVKLNERLEIKSFTESEALACVDVDIPVWY